MTEGFGVKNKKQLTQFRVIAESAFYMNNVKKLNKVSEVYKLAAKNKGTIISDQKIFEAKKLGFPKKSKLLIFNDGSVVGRTAAARAIVGEEGVDTNVFSGLTREAVYSLSTCNKIYHSEAFIGLDEDFIIKAHLLIPQGFENTMLSWLINFQEINKHYTKMYYNSKKIDENDLFIVADPNWKHPNYPYGLAFFSPQENTAFILGMRYFGEFKKGTLTLAWAVAERNGYTSCHGGLKSYDKQNYVAAFFGLSGSGKSTLTHAKHNNKYKTTILHDDAFIIDDKTLASIALEPTYFDKTSDYKIGAEDNKYILTAQNVGVSLNEKGQKILISEDIRNQNGRAIKSRLWSPNRVDKINKKINSIFWLMKDPVFPPILKINNTSLASVMGATLATKRTSAERLAEGVDPNALVFEPYANPFRTYPLLNDYKKFKLLFEKKVDCYILNTGFFFEQKITATITLNILEHIVENKKLEFKPLFSCSNIFYALPDEIKLPDEKEWKKDLLSQIDKRISYIKSLKKRDELPPDALSSLEEVKCELQG